jgi:hypothetical protein
MKTELRRVLTTDDKGVAIFITLILLFIVTIAGVTILAVAGRDRISSSDASAVRNVAEAANTALDACENQLSMQSQLMIVILNKYVKDKSYIWFFWTDSVNANKERKVSLGNGYSYSAEITAFDTSRNILQVRGIGYGRAGEQKTVTAIYNLSGVKIKSTPSHAAGYAIYLGGDGKYFDALLEITGDVYFGGDFAFNGNAANSIIHGFVKTRMDTTRESINNAPGLTIDSGFYIGTRLKANTSFNCNSRLGVEGRQMVGGTITVMDDVWSNDTNTGLGKYVLNSKIFHHSGRANMARVYNATEDNRKGRISNLAEQIGLEFTNDTAWSDSFAFLLPRARILPSPLNADTLQKMFNTCPAANKIGQYMVTRDPMWLSVNYVPTKFKGKVIMLLQNGMTINNKFLSMEDTARILIIAYNKAVIQGFGGPPGNQFNGVIYMRDSSDIIMGWDSVNTIKGAIHIRDAKVKWQCNASGKKLYITYDTSIVNPFVRLGVLKLPSQNRAIIENVKLGALLLEDLKIRSELMAVSY